MGKAIGMVEYKTVSAGVLATDAMVKTVDINLVKAQTVCSGKYIAVISGSISAVKAAIDAAQTLYTHQMINCFVLGNPHEAIFLAINGKSSINDVSALGILETYDVSSIIVAADEAAKAAVVDLVELRLAKEMCGKSYLMLTGEIAAVETAIERAKQVVDKDGMYLDSALMANPDKKTWKTILG